MSIKKSIKINDILKKHLILVLYFGYAKLPMSGKLLSFLHLGYNGFTIRVLGLKANVSYDPADEFRMKCTFFGEEASTECKRKLLEES